MTPSTAARQASLPITDSQSPPKPMSIEVVMPSDHLILCRPLLLPSVFPSIRVFSSESALRIRCPKYWSFSVSPSNEHPGLISFMMDWLDLRFCIGVSGEKILEDLSKAHSTEKESILMKRLAFHFKNIRKWQERNIANGYSVLLMIKQHEFATWQKYLFTAVSVLGPYTLC